MRISILLYVISLLFTPFLSAQERNIEEKKDTLTTKPSVPEEKALNARDTLPPAEKYGLRVGADISKLIRTSIDDDYTGLELVGDYRAYKDYHIAGELGNESITKNLENISTTTKGTYIRLGVDYNAYDNWYGMQNNIIAGIRYGIATFSQELNSFNITREVGSENAIFPIDIRTPESGDPRLGKFDNLTASWLEFVFGLKAEIANTNIYIGASVSLRRKLKEQDPTGFKSLYIPGFGITNDFSKFGVGYNYTITYLMPFYKKKR